MRFLLITCCLSRPDSACASVAAQVPGGHVGACVLALCISGCVSPLGAATLLACMLAHVVLVLAVLLGWCVCVCVMSSVVCVGGVLPKCRLLCKHACCGGQPCVYAIVGCTSWLWWQLCMVLVVVWLFAIVQISV